MLLLCYYVKEKRITFACAVFLCFFIIHYNFYWNWYDKYQHINKYTVHLQKFKQIGSRLEDRVREMDREGGGEG